MTLSTQFLTMLSMIGMGSLFGAMLDTYHRFLKRPHRKGWIVFLNDLLFWMIQALLIFYALFLANNGELRFYIFIALLCGFAAYQSLLKAMYLRLLEFLIETVISVSRFTKRTFLLLIYKPIVGLIQLVIAILLTFGRGLLSLVKFIWKVLLYILNVLFAIVKKILFVFWKLLPKGIKKSVEKLYNRTAGKSKEIVNYISNWMDKFRKRKE